MTTELSPGRRSAAATVRGLVGTAHAGPALAVTVLAALLSAAQGLDAGRGTTVVAAVLAGQLSVGWSNDLIDLPRDRAAGREDKPLATGAVPVALVRACCVAAVVACVALSLLCGLVAGLVHLGCVAAAWSYNLGLKSTIWSWAPYAVAFGALTAFVALAGGEAPPWWWPVGAALLGVGAHLLNVLPDLDDDAATGVRGLPHVLGPRRIAPIAAAVLVAATIVALVGAAPGPVVTIVTALVVLALAAVVVTGAGRRPFVAAIGIALVDAALLVVAR
jgi:4-hydroxybenzoate polyprenyltransferase